jgi:hypothetical protein
MDERDQLAKATRRVDAKIGLWIHLVVYVAVNTLLMVINLFTSVDYLWFWWPLLGWGVGLLFHALLVMFFSRGLSIRQRMIEKEMRK